MRVGCLTVLVSLLATAPVWGANVPIVAVFQIENKGGKLSAQAIDSLTDVLANTFAREGNYKIIPPDQVKDRLVAQKKKSFAQCYDQACQIEMGRELAADKVLAAQVHQIGNRCVFTATLYDLASATVEKAGKETLPRKCTEDGLIEALDSLVAQLVVKQVALGDVPQKPGTVSLGTSSAPAGGPDAAGMAALGGPPPPAPKPSPTGDPPNDFRKGMSGSLVHLEKALRILQVGGTKCEETEARLMEYLKANRAELAALNASIDGASAAMGPAQKRALSQLYLVQMQALMTEFITVVAALQARCPMQMVTISAAMEENFHMLSLLEDDETDPGQMDPIDPGQMLPPGLGGWTDDPGSDE